MRDNKQLLQIYLLKDDAWEDKAPKKLIQRSLNMKADNKRIVYQGKKTKPPPDEIK